MAAVLIHRFAAALALVLLAFSAVAAPAVAFVTDVQGGARIEGEGKVTFLREIAPETRIVLDSGALVTLMYSASGAEFTLKGPGEFIVEPSEVKALKGPAPTRKNVAVRPDPAVLARVSQSATASLRMRGVSPALPPVSKPGPLYPRGPVATLQPTMRWVGDPGPDGFVVVLHAADGKEVWKGPSRSLQQRLPMRLSPGKAYSWTVSAGATVLGEATFETLPAEAIAKAEKSRAATRSFADRVLHAFVLQDLGAGHDAREAWAELARERPDLPELAVLAR